MTTLRSAAWALPPDEIAALGGEGRSKPKDTQAE